MTDNSMDGLKQRLVGAFVILSLAVIFLPMIFDKPHHAVTSQLVELPPKPEFKKVEIKQATPPNFEEIKLDPADQRVKPASSVAKANTEAGLEKETDAKIVPAAEAEKSAVDSGRQETPKVADLPVFQNVWMVQLGTFSDSTNAYKLRDRLRQDGFDGHTKKIDINGKPAIRVFTGPFVNKREAARIKKRVDDRYRVDSLLVFFDA